ncbi:MAG: thiamine diphosphokinase [Desulfobacterales bacterium]|uniref:Thiamine diphosphokinase n=1 Tax=Candidatus Desulfaltia bathyphila TaxID=2841697 RepID=A0A8J6N4D8_9BACT|nr:thiamine diphosphokinase [Candidatus Desulfaltia bathyphila]MBL7194938.1 thiamine diphosphokinase [Desulfobacterales bacterium]MBL7207468.1 thiamine diphosphokinase [Desulfobacterales bacterium]
MRTIIFANGIIDDTGSVFSGNDLIIAADGGLHHCLSLGITPDVVIGDIDSLTANDINGLQIANVEIIRYPAKKDQTDLELALKLAIDRGADEIVVFGAMGGRWDMSIANILLPAEQNLSNATIRIIDGRHEIMLLRAGKEITFHGEKGDILSLIPLGRDALGITTIGLEYPLKDDVLKFGSSRGISNVFIENSATVFLKQGLLLCVHIRKEFEVPKVS